MSRLRRIRAGAVARAADHFADYTLLAASGGYPVFVPLIAR